MKKCSVLIFAILVGATNLLRQTEIGAKEYAVYAAVLRVIYEHNRETYPGKSEFVFIDRTSVDPELDLPKNKKYRNLVKDFLRRNEFPGTLEKKFPRGPYSESYLFVSQAEIDKLGAEARTEFEKRYAVEKLNPQILNPGGSPWTNFYQKFPDASGHYYLSRVGFDGRYAIVNVKGDLGWNGFSRIYVLKQIKDGWKTISTSGSEWIS